MKPEVLEAGIDLARQVGYRNVTLAGLAERLGKPHTWAVNHVSLSELWAHLRDNAAELGLNYGELNKPQRCGFWSEEDGRRMLELAYDFACKNGLSELSHNRMAGELGVARNTVRKYFSNDIRGAVVRQAVAQGNLGLISQGLALGVPAARDASDSLKERALCLLK